MQHSQTRLIVAGLALALALGGCAQPGGGSAGGMSNTSKGAIAGGVVGALAGGLTQGHDKAKRALIGAGIGALAGAAVGSYMDQQEQQLKGQLAGSGVDVVRQGDSIVLNMPEAISFDTGRAALKPGGEAQIGKIAAVIKQYDKTIVDVAGHADSSGNPQSNMALSQRRAAAVASALVRDGIPQSRMVINGYGDTRPVADNASEAGRAANRRVEITLLPLTQG